jgi:hypothetical protein
MDVSRLSVFSCQRNRQLQPWPPFLATLAFLLQCEHQLVPATVRVHSVSNCAWAWEGRVAIAGDPHGIVKRGNGRELGYVHFIRACQRIVCGWMRLCVSFTYKLECDENNTNACLDKSACSVVEAAIRISAL